MVKQVKFLTFFSEVMFFLILINSYAYATKVFVWEPDRENKYGHVSVQTHTYHMSLWPQDDLDNVYDQIKAAVAVPGCLVLHDHYDRFNEGERDPRTYSIGNISERSVDSAYEDLLAYNNITPDNVTLDTIEDIMKRHELDKNMALKRKNPRNQDYRTSELQSKLSRNLSKSRYSFIGNFSMDSSPWKNFYKKEQSCTTLSRALLSRNSQYNHPPSDEELNISNAILAAKTGFFLPFRKAVEVPKMVGALFVDGFNAIFNDGASEILPDAVDDLTSIRVPYVLEVPDFQNFIVRKVHGTPIAYRPPKEPRKELKKRAKCHIVNNEIPKQSKKVDKKSCCCLIS